MVNSLGYYSVSIFHMENVIVVFETSYDHMAIKLSSLSDVIFQILPAVGNTAYLKNGLDASPSNTVSTD